MKFLAENAVFDEGREAVYLPDFVSDYPSWEVSPDVILCG